MAGDGEQDKRWNRFQKLRFDKKQTLKRLRKAEAVSIRHAHKFILKRWRNVRDVRRIVITWVVAVSCLIGAAGLQLYWDRQSYQTTAGATGGTYTEAVIGPLDTLNPLFASTPAAEAVSQLVFSRLVTYDATGNLSYDIATNVEVDSRQRVYTVSLRDDVRWHDGKRLTADDVVFTVELLKDPLVRAQQRGWSEVIVSKKDDFTVQFTLTDAYAPFLSALDFPIIPKHVLEHVPRDAIREHSFSVSPVGSGPFGFRLLQDMDSADKRMVHLAANTSYYRGAPKLSRLQLLVVPDESAVLTALRRNEVNSASGVTRGLIGQLPEGRYEVHTQPVQGGVYALLNNDSDILSDKMVRRALQRATDTSKIRERVGGVPALSLPYTESHLQGEDVYSVPGYDLKEAQRLLDAAGWKLDNGVRKKSGKELRLSVVTTQNVDYERALEVLIGQWRQLGIIIDERVIDVNDPAQSFIQSVLQPRAYDVLLYQLNIGRDPDVFAFWHSSQAVARGLNLANYSNPVADDILTSARSGSSDALRLAKHKVFVRQWVSDAPAIGLYQSVTHTVVSNGVGGMSWQTELPSLAQRYSDVIYWTVGQRTVYKTP